MVPKGIFAAVFLLTAVGIAQAGVIYTGGVGTTVYGATQYTCPGGPPCSGPPQFIFNNVTGLQDILSTPGNGYQIANPVIANNVAESGPPGPTPYFFNWVGGVSGDGSPFGAGSTVNTGPLVGFALNDPTVGCCSASYMITSWTADYTVDANGFNSPVDAFLGLAGTNFASVDSSVASLVIEYSVNGGPLQDLTPMILAIGGSCTNDVAGGDVAVVLNSACPGVGGTGNGGAFQAAALDSSAPLALVGGNTIDFVATLTVYADPASIDSIAPDLSLLNGLDIPGGLPSDTLIGDAASVPEPGSLLLFGSGFGLVAFWRLRAARRARA